MRYTRVPLALLLALAATADAARAQSGAAAYRALGLTPQEVLTGTVLTSRVLPGADKQVVCIATYFTGKKGASEAVNVRFGVFRGAGKDLVEVYRRDLGADHGGHVANGDLQVLDLDLDGVNEIVISFDSYEDSLIDQRRAEVILHDGSRLTTAWSGLVEYDATRAARSVGRERRDRFVREFDWGRTLRSRGSTLFFTKRVIAVAGERLPEPQLLEESFKLRGAPGEW